MINNLTLTKDYFYLKECGYNDKEIRSIRKAWEKFNYRKAKIKNEIINNRDIELIEFTMRKQQNNGGKYQKLLVNWI